MASFRLALALCLALPAAAATSIWLVGRLFTDSIPQTQYIFWVPALLLLPAAALFGAGAWAVHWVGRPWRHLRTRAERRWRRAFGLLAIACIACLAWQMLIGWRLYRQILPQPAVDAGRAVHVFHWNMTGQSPTTWEANLARLPDAPRPDLLLLTNAHQGTRFRELREQTEMDTAHWRHLALASRFPILRSDGASLMLPRPEAYPTVAGEGDAATGEPDPNPARPGWYDPGQIFFAELDTTSVLGRPIVVCVIDLPSNPAIPRRDVARLVLERLNELDRHWQNRSGSAFDGVPVADLIAGDFNMTRGSAALSRITDGLTHAYRHAGSGLAATYPSPNPLWHIDHIFLRPPLKAVRYDVVDLGGSSHLAQHAVITTRSSR